MRISPTNTVKFNTIIIIWLWDPSTLSTICFKKRILQIHKRFKLSWLEFKFDNVWKVVKKQLKAFFNPLVDVVATQEITKKVNLKSNSNNEDNLV